MLGTLQRKRFCFVAIINKLKAKSNRLCSTSDVLAWPHLHYAVYIFTATNECKHASYGPVVPEIASSTLRTYFNSSSLKLMYVAYKLAYLLAKSAPILMRNLTTRWWPFWLARSNGVISSMSSSFRGTGHACSKASTHSRCPDLI